LGFRFIGPTSAGIWPQLYHRALLRGVITKNLPWLPNKKRLARWPDRRGGVAGRVGRPGGKKFNTARPPRASGPGGRLVFGMTRAPGEARC
jgi:hypothetical protein